MLNQDHPQNENQSELPDETEPLLNDAERAMLDNKSTLKRLAVIAEAVNFELDLRAKLKEELEQERDAIEENINYAEAVVTALEDARDSIKETVAEIEAIEQSEAKPE